MATATMTETENQAELAQLRVPQMGDRVLLRYRGNRNEIDAEPARITRVHLEGDPRSVINAEVCEPVLVEDVRKARKMGGDNVRLNCWFPILASETPVVFDGLTRVPIDFDWDADDPKAGVHRLPIVPVKEGSFVAIFIRYPVVADRETTRNMSGKIVPVAARVVGFNEATAGLDLEILEPEQRIGIAHSVNGGPGWCWPPETPAVAHDPDDDEPYMGPARPDNAERFADKILETVTTS